MLQFWNICLAEVPETRNGTCGDAGKYQACHVFIMAKASRSIVAYKAKFIDHAFAIDSFRQVDKLLDNA